MIKRLARAIIRTYDYCKVCGWWVQNCGHPQG
jgi:hypothetical protein